MKKISIPFIVICLLGILNMSCHLFDNGGEGAEGESIWNVSGNNIYYMAGNVGIGTVNPGTKLDVAGSLTIGSYTLPSEDGTLGYTLKTDGQGTVSWAPDIEGNGGSGDGYSLDAQDGDPLDALFVDADGNVGIGTTTPGAFLDVAGSVRIGDYILPSVDGTSGYVLKTDGSGTVTWEQDIEGSGGSGDGNSLDALDGSPLDALFVDADGNVGIGTTTPGSLLEVNGPVTIGSYTLPATDGAAGYILITNGNGTISWQQDPLVAALAAKADLTDMLAALAAKANQADMDTALAAKANQAAVDTALAAKADQATVNAALAAKADLTDMLAALAAKANQADMDTALAAKADQTDMNSALAEKADMEKLSDIAVFAMGAGTLSGLSLNGGSRGILMVYIINSGSSTSLAAGIFALHGVDSIMKIAGDGMDDQQNASTYNVYYSGGSLYVQNTSASDIIARATFFGG